MRLFSTCFVLLSTLLSAPLVLATQHAHGRKVSHHAPTAGEHKKRKSAKTTLHKKKQTITPVSQRHKAGTAYLHPRSAKVVQEKEETTTVKLSPAHKKRYQHAKQTAMTKLMKQVGKPYHFGGTSPLTGFDCSGLVYYAYKDVMRIKMPRTANEMFHLHGAAPIKKNQLEMGDLVFFRINNRGTADHVGVYLGGGKFIQSPRSGEEIRVSHLSDDYWQNHYIGARRVMTPKTIR